MSTARDEKAFAPAAVTGVAVLTPLGDSPDSLERALFARQAAVAPVADLGGSGFASIADFEATRYANVRGLRLYNRTTRFGICAGKLALADSGIETVGLPKEQLGVILASTFGHLETLFEYDRSLVTAGLQRTNPALMPLAIPSAPGAAIALSFGAKAFSITLSNGGVSSLDALGLGARLVQGGRARACLVVGAFSPCPDLLRAAWRAGLLAEASQYRVFDRRRHGMAFAEAGAAVVLERPEDARARGVEPVAFVSGQASTFAADPALLETSLLRAGEGALRTAGLDSKDVDLVSAGASGARAADEAEARALLGLLGDGAGRVPVSAIKANLGETMDAAGLVQVVAAVSAMRSGKAPPIAGLEHPEVPGLRYLTEETAVEVRHALVTSISYEGACSALVVSRWYER